MLLQVTLNDLGVSEDPDERIQSSGSVPLTGQNTDSGSPRASNYWVFIVVILVLVLTWIFCMSLVRKISVAELPRVLAPPCLALMLCCCADLICSDMFCSVLPRLVSCGIGFSDSWKAVRR